MLASALHHKAHTFAHCWLENKGGGQFERHDLAQVAQVSSINQVVPFRYNADAFPDLLVAGNLYGAEVETPRNDAGLGMVLTGGKTGIAWYVPARQSGLFLTDDLRGLQPIRLGRAGRQGGGQ